MKKRFTVLTAAVLLLSLMVPSLAVWGGQIRTEEVAYTLTPANGSNNTYAGNCDITISGITWNLTGNSQMQPWRIGGKNLSGVDRALYSKTAISDNITKIEVTHGTASSVKVNSWTVIVSKNSDFSSPVSTLTPTFAANTTTTINRPDDADWTGCYYKFVYNVTIGGDNKFIQFTEAKFYKESSGGGGTTTYTVTYDANGGTGTMTDSNSPYTAGATVTVLDNEFTRDNYTFNHWNTAADDSGTDYDEGDEFTIDANTTLYAQWTENGGGGSSNTQTLTFDLTSNPGGWPTTNSTTLTNYTYTLNSVDYTFALKNVKCNSGYLMCTYTAVLGLPAIEGYKLTKVVAHNSTTCSTSTRVGISSSYSSVNYITGGSYQTWTTKDIDYTYNLSSTEANTMYYMYVTSANAQVTQLKLTYEYVAPSTDPAINVDSELAVTPVAVANGELAVTYDNIEPTSGTITLYDAQDNDITESCTWFTPAFNADFSKVTYTATENISGAVNSVRMHLNLSDGTDSAEADVAVTQDFILTTMDQILIRATANGSTEKDVTIYFNNWVISGVNNSSYQYATKAWLTDGTKGCVVACTNSSYSKFMVNDKLNGKVTCKLKLNTGFAQISSLVSGNNGTTATTGLTVTNDGTVNVVTGQSITDYSAVNTGSVITLTGLSCTSSYSYATGYTLSDGTNTIYFKGGANHAVNNTTLTEGKTYNMTGIFEYVSSSKYIYPRSASDIEEVIPTTPTIYANPETLSGFTYVEGNGPSATQTVSVSGTNLEGNITLAMNDGEASAFEISLSENGNYSNSLTLTPSEGNVSATTVYVRMKAGLSILAEGYSDEINLNSTPATQVSVSLAGTVTPPVVTWDLSVATYVTDPAPTEDLIQWTSSYVTMKNEKNGGTKVTNYLGGSGTYTHTRMYSNNLLTFTPASGYIIASIVMTGTNSSNFSNGLNDDNFNNGTVTISDNIATITPTNGNIPVSVTVSATIQVSSVTVYYSVSTATNYTISIDNEMTNGSVVADKSEATAGATITLTIYPAAGYYLEDNNIMVDATDVELTKINAGQFTFEMPEEDVTVSATFSSYTGTYYTLVNSTVDLIPGRHYIIASSKSAGGAYAMGAQNSGYRERVAVNVVGNFIYGQPTGLHEVVLSGDGTNLWTLYDDGIYASSKGYLYASSTSSNNIGTRPDNVTTNPERGQWAINITEGVASIVSQIGDDKPNTIRYNDGNSRFSCYNNSQAPVYLYMKADETDYEFYSNTTLSESNIITVSANSILTVNAGTLTNDNPAYLIIKDGGQLKFYDNGAKDGGVQATVEKNISGYGGDNTVKTGWNFIASPINVSDLAANAVTNMLSNTYDLYQLNNTKWENYKDNEGHTNANPGFSLVNGHGYLYANSDDVTLSFAGAVKPFNTEDPTANRVAVSAGWNLIGNPYTFDVYVNQPYYSISQAQTGITANTDASYATAIKPCTGILVYAKSIDYVEFLENEPVASTGNHGNIQMTLAHNVATRDGNRSETIDNAIVSFNEDAHLEKFYFGEPEANIYIPQNGRDYAIAFSNRQGDVPLNFKTNKISTYTISFEGEEMNLNGVYLIDMLEEEEIDLGTKPSYTFLGSPSDKAARFKIVFRNTGDDADSDIFAYQNGTDIIVSGEGELQIFDVMGRKVSSQRINGVETMCTSSLQNGFYVFRLNEKTQKIVVR